MTGRALGWLIVSLFVFTLAVGGGVLWQSKRMADDSVRRSEQKLCDIVVLGDDAYRRSPPTTDLGLQQARNFAKLRRDLGCPPPTTTP